MTSITKAYVGIEVLPAILMRTEDENPFVFHIFTRRSKDNTALQRNVRMPGNESAGVCIEMSLSKLHLSKMELYILNERL